MNSARSDLFSPKKFFYNGLISAVSALALRFAAMLFNVYVSSYAGAGSMGLLSLIYSVWGFAVTSGCGGGGLASAIMCAESASRGESRRSACKKCLLYGFLCSFCVGALLYITSPAVGKFLSSEDMVKPLRILCLSLPFISMSGVMNGYFNSKQHNYKSAICSISEQAVRIAVTVIIFRGLRGAKAAEYCTAIILGGAAADAFCFLMQAVFFALDKRTEQNAEKGSSVTLHGIAKITLPVCISASARSGLVSLEHALIPKGLCAFGYTASEALSLFGTVHGMAIPVILFCISVPSAFSVMLIPKIAEHRAVGNISEIRYIQSRAYRTSIIFSFGVASFLCVSSLLIGKRLYPETNAADYIRIFAPLIPIMYVDSISDSVLKGMGEQLYSMKINIADAAISLLCVFLLVPRHGVIGYVIAIYLSETFNTCASMLRIISSTGYRMPIIRFVLLPLLFSVISANALGIYYSVTDAEADAVTLTIGALMFTAAYFFLLVITKSISREELAYFKSIIMRGKRGIPAKNLRKDAERA